MPRFKLFDLVDWTVRARSRLFPFKGPRRGVLLVSSGGIGDTMLFSLVVARFQALAVDGEPVNVIVRGDTHAAAFLYPPGITLVPVDYRRFVRSPLYRLRTCIALQKTGYRLAISADHYRLPTVDDALVMACAAEESVAMEPRTWPKHDRRLQGNRRWYTRWSAVREGLAHRMIRWVDFANDLTGQDDPPPVVTFPSERLPAPADLESPTVLIHPFSAIRPRQFPVGMFRAIIDSLPEDHRVILSAGPGDLDRNPDYAALVGGRVRVNTEGFESKAALVRAVRLVVSVDTSVMHLAVGAGTPTLCLATAAHVIDSIPYDAAMTPGNVTFLYHDMDCRGCLGNCIHPLEDGVYPCVARLGEDEVIKAVATLLAGCNPS